MRKIIYSCWVMPLCVIALCGCATTSTTTYDPTSDLRNSAAYQDAQKVLSVTVDSIPSGAKVYSVSGASIGEYLGDTPYTFKFRCNYWAGDGTWGCSGCGATLDQVLEYKVHYPTAGFFGYREIDLAFKCYVVQDGYRPYFVRVVFGNKSVNGIQWQGRRESFTAMLEAERKYVSPAPPPAPSQQQQQQQQQTVVIGNGRSNDQEQLGTVMVSASIEGAEVMVDGMFVGNVPANLKLTAGVHVIEVRKNGYQAFKRELRVFGNSELSLRAELEK